MEAMVQRLDRLTQDEARQTVAEILKIVHGLVGNIKVVMGGEQIHQACRTLSVEDNFPLDGEISVAHFKETLGMFSGHNQVIVYLTEDQKLCMRSRVV